MGRKSNSQSIASLYNHIHVIHISVARQTLPCFYLTLREKNSSLVYFFWLEMSRSICLQNLIMEQAYKGPYVLLHFT